MRQSARSSDASRCAVRCSRFVRPESGGGDAGSSRSGWYVCVAGAARRAWRGRNATPRSGRPQAPGAARDRRRRNVVLADRRRRQRREGPGVGHGGRSEPAVRLGWGGCGRRAQEDPCRRSRQACASTRRPPAPVRAAGRRLPGPRVRGPAQAPAREQGDEQLPDGEEQDPPCPARARARARNATNARDSARTRASRAARPARSDTAEPACAACPRRPGSGARAARRPACACVEPPGAHAGGVDVVRRERRVRLLRSAARSAGRRQRHDRAAARRAAFRPRPERRRRRHRRRGRDGRRSSGVRRHPHARRRPLPTGRQRRIRLGRAPLGARLPRGPALGQAVVASV